MKRARMTLLVVGGMLLASMMTIARSDVTARAEIDPEVLAAREAAWRAYFAGDVKALGGVLPPEFIGLGMTDGPFTDRATTLDEARAFQQQGGRLVHLAFPETKAQQFGDVVVLYGRYEAVIETGGVEHTVRGRLTELFVRRDGKWLHPGWHLDQAAGPGATP